MAQGISGGGRLDTCDIFSQFNLMAKPTINDVAHLAGVSEKAVDLAISRSPLLSRATREKIEKVITEIGFVPDLPAPAPAPAPVAAPTPSPASMPRRNSLIALVYEEGDCDGALVSAAQQGILNAIRDTEFALVIHPLAGEGKAWEADLRRFLGLHSPFGVILLPPLSGQERVAGQCAELGCGYVCLEASPSGGEEAGSAKGDRGAAARVVGQLVSLGHERIGFITGPDESRSARERELGYLDAMADHGLDRGPSLIASGDNSFASGIAAGRLLLEVSPRPTAILAGTDEMAAGAMHAAGERGIAVPTALSIIGFGDTAIASLLWPPLTTVRVPIAEMARAAVCRLIDPDAAQHLPAPFEPVIITRGSVGPAPA